MKKILFLSIFLSLALIFGSCARPAPEMPTTPEPSEEEEVIVEEPTKVPEFIELIWATGGPPCWPGEKYHAGGMLTDLAIISADGNQVVTIECLGMNNYRVWKSEDGGKTWTEGPWEEWERLLEKRTARWVDFAGVFPTALGVFPFVVSEKYRYSEEYRQVIYFCVEKIEQQFQTTLSQVYGVTVGKAQNDENFLLVLAARDMVLSDEYYEQRPYILRGLDFPPESTMLYLSFDGGESWDLGTVPPFLVRDETKDMIFNEGERFPFVQYCNSEGQEILYLASESLPTIINTGDSYKIYIRHLRGAVWQTTIPIE